MRRIINFGNVDYNNSGRKNCKVTVEVELQDGRLSICGNVWNPRETDIYCGGQCLEELQKLLPHNKKLARIVEVWRKWHLNDMKAGTPAQEAELAKHTFPGYPMSHYEWACGILEKAGLLYVANPIPKPQDSISREWPSTYKYGTEWLKEELPAEIVAEVESWFASETVAA